MPSKRGLVVLSNLTQYARFGLVTNAIVLCAALACTALPLDANAASIIGDITMSGDFVPTGGTGVDLSDATGLDFLDNDFNVESATGDFMASGISTGDDGVINDFQFAPLLPSPVDPLWSIAGFSFVMDSVPFKFQNSLFLILEGGGTISASGFDDTPGTWQFSANNAGSLFNFSAGFSSVPEPSTMFLVGIGLAGIALFRRLSSMA